ncbi:hypothetical protein C8R45DRAFT_1114336 [Mycena sanguinolenta]|nr:hypothetical protein C8R45DRAFT_1114336 [Mycena sanguinolenta]
MSNPTFSFDTTAQEVATAFADIIRGKNVLVTGSSSGGIGFETARVLAKYAMLVIITGHNANRLKLAEEAIKKEEPSANIRPLVLDLSLASAKPQPKQMLSRDHCIFVLIHNAAAPIGPFQLTVDNLESQMATDHIGSFLFTKLLAPKILAARTELYTPRVSLVSRGGHRTGSGVNFDTLGRPDSAGYSPMDAYGQSKSANILTGIELSSRSGGKIHAFSLHPGRMFTNIMQKGVGTAEMQKFGFLDADGQPPQDANFKNIAQAAATTVVAAFDPRLNVANELVAPHSSDANNAERLTEEIIRTLRVLYQLNLIPNLL